MEKFKIPRTARGVTDELGQIGSLLTAIEWKRAALLASVVRLPGSGGARDRGQTPVAGFETADQFAERGIAGLRKGDTVRLYVQRWLDANDGKYPELGKSVTLPDTDWPPSRTGTDGYETDDGAQRTIARIVEKHGPDAIASAVVDNPVLDSAVSRKRLDRVSDPADRRALNERNRQRDGDLRDSIGASHAALADHIDHEVELELMTVEAHMRRAVSKMEAFPYMSESQRGRMLNTLGRIDAYVAILRKGGEGMTDADRDFLASVGVES